MTKSILLMGAICGIWITHAAPASAQLGLIGGILGAGASMMSAGAGADAGVVPGSGFSGAAATLAINLKTALYNQGMALALVEEAMGNGKKANLFRSQANAIQSVKAPSKDQLVKMQKTIEENPINYAGLAKVQSEAGKKKIAQGQAHMDVVVVYNGLALLSAGAMILQRPSVGDIASAPTILEAAQLALTALPEQSSNAKKFNEAVEAYMKQNNVSKLTTAQKTAMAKKTDPNAAKNAASF